MKYFKKVIGERIYLSPMNPDDAETYVKWLNDINVANNLGNYPAMMTLKGEREWLENSAMDNYNFAIVLKENDTLIGNIGINERDARNQTATIGLFIGEEEMRGKGYGGEAIKLLLKFGHETLNLNNFMLHVHADNEQAIACYKKVGFKEIGRRRQAVYKNGKHIDGIFMDIIASDIYF